MQINIKVLGRALFASSTRYLDLDTGETCSERLIAEGLIDAPIHFVVLPMYSRAVIYQRYLRELFDALPFEDTCGLSSYPEFGFDGRNSAGDHEEIYIGKAFHFIEEVESDMLCNRETANARYDPSFPTFSEYFASFTTDIAKDWCEREGYAWY